MVSIWADDALPGLGPPIEPEAQIDPALGGSESAEPLNPNAAASFFSNRAEQGLEFVPAPAYGSISAYGGPSVNAAPERSLTNLSVDDLDDEQDKERTGRLHAMIKKQSQGGLTTAGDAYDTVERLMNEQIQKATDSQTPPNEPFAGDSTVRLAFQLLLSDNQQRSMFLRLASKTAAWPRLRTLIGAPPYHFLRVEDANTLNATGFARGRINMVYETGNRIANLQQFGPGQLVDEYDREYRVAPQEQQDSDPLPGAGYFGRSAQGHMLQVKIKRHRTEKKRELFRSASKKRLFFPQPGETIVLQETEELLNALGTNNKNSTTLRVKALYPRGQGASTAAVLVTA